ncbi:hypothetical protein Dfulv_20080 [Dactylosporangium fulvum]|uniref:RING-type domain-containing protein n=1 Tax=Dactylosporangium fulvum TaxID=53359 RepID=A0ABY5WDK2_9ACTN|nr:RING finger family 4 domain-containing protein [Dactylosporangium fulvum]UWP86411.1 hypothetical protein Dfulv_20080 [Dactylosporangium fulvum]
MDALATALLRRAGLVPLPEPGPQPPADGDAWVTTLEADLAARGWLLDTTLRARFARLDPATRLRWADWVQAVADAMVGADRDHVPLFRRFPETPEDPALLYRRRLLVLLFQPGEPGCLICGRSGVLHPLDPCAHLVCTECFSPERFSACPICGRRTAAGTAYLPVAAIRAAAAGPAADFADPQSPAGPAVPRVLAAAIDADRLTLAMGGEVADGSVALLADGRAAAPWTAATAADLLAALVPG